MLSHLLIFPNYFLFIIHPTKFDSKIKMAPHFTLSSQALLSALQDELTPQTRRAATVRVTSLTSHWLLTSPPIAEPLLVTRHDPASPSLVNDDIIQLLCPRGHFSSSPSFFFQGKCCSVPKKCLNPHASPLDGGLVSGINSFIHSNTYCIGN